MDNRERRKKGWKDREDLEKHLPVMCECQS